MVLPVSMLDATPLDDLRGFGEQPRALCRAGSRPRWDGSCRFVNCDGRFCAPASCNTGIKPAIKWPTHMRIKEFVVLGRAPLIAGKAAEFLDATDLCRATRVGHRTLL